MEGTSRIKQVYVLNQERRRKKKTPLKQKIGWQPKVCLQK
jgi:hypothetical protein